MDNLRLYVSSNEQNVPDRVADLVKALERFDGTIKLAGYDDLPTDLVASSPKGEVLVELKEIGDLYSSMNSGHLGDQLIQMIASSRPSFIVVFGGLREVLAGVPKYAMTKNGRVKRRTLDDFKVDRYRVRKLTAVFDGCNIPVRFLDRDRVLSFTYALECCQEILGEPNISPFLPRFSAAAEPYAALCVVRGIGNEAAKAMVKRFGSIRRLCEADPEEVAACPLKGTRKLGYTKAAKVLHMLGVGIPAQWGAMAQDKGSWVLTGGKYGRRVAGM